jgi:predicted RNA methylase
VSSTNRANAKERHQSDFYRTPVEAIKDFIEEFRKDYPDFEAVTILDPCCGGCGLHDMSYPVAIREHSTWKNYKLGTVDIREDSRASIKGDFLKMSFPFKFDLTISNPPFVLAKEFVTKALEVTRDNGFVVMLLRLNFFGSKSRFDWWKENMPVACYVHHARMSFTDDNKTDSIEYMHCVWKKGVNPSSTALKII